MNKKKFYYFNRDIANYFIFVPKSINKKTLTKKSNIMKKQEQKKLEKFEKLNKNFSIQKSFSGHYRMLNNNELFFEDSANEDLYDLDLSLEFFNSMIMNYSR